LIEVIPGKLKVKVFVHDIPYGGEKIACWTYATEGLFSLKYFGPRGKHDL
jgi:hypothetical protein